MTNSRSATPRWKARRRPRDLNAEIGSSAVPSSPRVAAFRRCARLRRFDAPPRSPEGCPSFHAGRTLSRSRKSRSVRPTTEVAEAAWVQGSRFDCAFDRRTRSSPHRRYGFREAWSRVERARLGTGRRERFSPPLFHSCDPIRGDRIAERERGRRLEPVTFARAISRSVPAPLAGRTYEWVVVEPQVASAKRGNRSR